MTQITIEILISVFACTGFWEFLRYIVSSRKKKQSAEDRALLAILHELVYPKLEDCIIRQSVGLEEFDRIDNLVQPYFALGGNGTVRRRYDMVLKLPRTDDRAEGFDDEY